MKRRMGTMRDDQAEDIGSGVHYSESHYRETLQGSSTLREQCVPEAGYLVQEEGQGR